MKNRNVFQLLILGLLVLSLAGCNEDDEFLTVSEVWQDATALDGKRIRVRGPGRLQYEPVHPMRVGGCSPVPSANPPIKARAVIFEEPLDYNPKHELFISESSLKCEGNTCSMTCTPFDPPQDLHGYVNPSITNYEFVGTLRVDSQGSEEVLILDDIDIEASRQLVDEKWEPIPAGEFSWLFP